MHNVTLDELIKLAIGKNIDLGERPENTIKKYVKLELLPKPIRRKKKG